MINGNKLSITRTACSAVIQGNVCTWYLPFSFGCARKICAETEPDELRVMPDVFKLTCQSRGRMPVAIQKNGAGCAG